MARLCSSLVAATAEDPDSAPVPRPTSSASARMDYGSMLTYTVGLPPVPGKTNANLALKGICIRLGASNEAAVCFDTDLLRYYAGWTGGFLDLSKTHLTSYKGSDHALIQGEVKFQTALEPGWSRAGDFNDPRPIQAGPLPPDWGQFRGLYRHGDRVVLHYVVGGIEVWEMPEFVRTNGVDFFLRNFHLDKSNRNLALRLCDLEDWRDEESRQQGELSDPAPAGLTPAGNRATRRIAFNVFRMRNRTVGVGFMGRPANQRQISHLPPLDDLPFPPLVKQQRGRVQLEIPSLSTPADFTVILWSVP
ncbi:MAG TPA: DUF6797 domain-containing protein, partial [Candidatus Binatia bacterium]|nr:DUF6797 domain-containing protein [Candidatus Binatia bacterium]